MLDIRSNKALKLAPGTGDSRDPAPSKEGIRKRQASANRREEPEPRSSRRDDARQHAEAPL